MEEKVLIILQSNPGSTTTQVSQLTKAHPVSTSKALSTLEQEGLVERVIKGRHSYFTISNPKVYSILEQLETEDKGEPR